MVLGVVNQCQFYVQEGWILEAMLIYQLVCVGQEKCFGRHQFCEKTNNCNTKHQLEAKSGITWAVICELWLA